jgi:alpha-tubulin suppressor-like RCC1 family protein
MKAFNSLQSTLRALALAAPLAVLVACGGGGGGYGPAAPSVTSITPLAATANAPTVFTVLGFGLPLTAALVPQDGTCAAATGNTATGFSQQCTFASAGQKSLVVPVGSGYSFTVNVSPSQYVKICNDGSREGTFSCPTNPVQGNASNEWACTLDTLTNKMWEVKTNDNGLRDYAKQYTSFDAITKNQKSVGSALVPPTQLEVDAATNVVGYANALNGTGGQTPLCGSTKWRVPSLPELAALVKGTTAPTIDSVYFPNTNAQPTITSTPEIFLPPGAAAVTSTNSISVVNFNTGNTVTEYINRNFLKPVRLVSVPSSKADVSKRIAAGAHHNCAVKNNGDVFCWGFGSGGVLGNGIIANSSVPVKVSMSGAVSAIAAGDYHTCAIKNSGDVVCWGSGNSGQLGNGANLNATTPVTVSLTGGVSSISAGGDNTCAIKLNGQLVCWGRGDVGGLGNGLNVNSNLPVAVTVSGVVTDVSVGSGHVCAIKNNSDVICWGNGVNGQLGNGTFTNSNIPVSVSLPGGAIAISAGGLFSCAIKINGQTVCWGENSYSQLGNGTSGGTPGTSIPTAVNVPAGAAKLSAGTFHACAISSAGNTLCWGYGVYGQLGRGSTADSNTPVPATVPTASIAALALGAYHTCALKTNTSIDCWGYGIYGQLGNGGTADATTPVAVMGF